MNTIYNIKAFDGGACVLAVGKFDGVHAGHQLVLSEAVRIARLGGVPSVALTFDMHPLALIDPAKVPSQLTSEAQKRDLIERTGIDIMIVLRFTEALAGIEPEQFVELLSSELRPIAIVCGESFTFGHRARGNAKLLIELERKHGYETVLLPLCEVDGEQASSTKIRELLTRGEREKAEKLLKHSVDTERC